MNAAAALLADLRHQGLRIRPHDVDALELSPRALLTDELRPTIRANKPDLLTLLRSEGEAERRLAPHAARLPRAESGFFADAMRASGLTCIVLRPAVTTTAPDICLQTAYRLARAVLADPERRDHPTWRTPLADALETVRVVAQLAPKTAALEDPAR